MTEYVHPLSAIQDHEKLYSDPGFSMIAIVNSDRAIVDRDLQGSYFHYSHQI